MAIPKKRKFLTTPVMRRSLAYKAMLRRGWIEVGVGEDFDYFWADVYSVGQDSGFNFTSLKSHQKLNHFQRHTELTRKDALVKNVKRVKRQLERAGKDWSAYDFLPQTYVLPQEFSMFAEEFKKYSGQTWIMKPCGRSQGDGIFLVSRIRQVAAWCKLEKQKQQAEPYIVSRYIQDPLLIGGRKFDIRLYVLVTCIAPLQIYIHRGGFCRFSCGLYEAGQLDDLTLHLTNIAIQKRQGDYDPATGMKWALSELRKYLQESLGYERTDRVFAEIQDVVVHSLLATQHLITADRHCFELFGYDVLLDANLKPWLLEVNASPSLSADTCMDLKLKNRMLDDVLALIDSPTEAMKTGGFDLIYSDGQAQRSHPLLGSLLGCCTPS